MYYTDVKPENTDEQSGFSQNPLKILRNKIKVYNRPFFPWHFTLNQNLVT